ncbi:MAG: triose-phosphate isomerase [Deltaproteobacteria bacterium]|nr:triose-phosphate isomerase [Deltaproteobacteria bacterium]
MARRQLIAGNWKMFKTVSEAVSFVTELRDAVASIKDCDFAVAPPYLAIHAVAQKLAGSNIGVSAQEMFYEDQGAFTGCISGPMIKEAGCTYTLIAHSERRQYFGETNESSNKRLQATLRAGLVPILCVGETLEQREAGKTNEIVKKQLEGALAGFAVADLAKLIIAYEPVWAIGTGKVATPIQAQEAHAFIRSLLRTKDTAWADTVRILYGGSVKPDNAAELLGQPDIDGGLVGGASLKVDSFVGIAKGRKS